MRGFQRSRNEENQFVAHEAMKVRTSVAIKSNGFGGDAVLSALHFFSHFKHSMRHKRICFISAALESSHSGLQSLQFQYLSYCCIGVCARGLQLHAAWWLDPERHSDRDSPQSSRSFSSLFYFAL